MLSLSPAVRIFLYTAPTDMRCGFPRLAMYAEAIIGQDPCSGHLFVFFNRRGDRCKILFWDRTGFCIWYKQLQQGTFQRVDNPAHSTVLELDLAGLAMILEGIDLSGVKRRKRYRRKISV